ncbi:hypothetical protein, partial [Aestuariivirga sp.]|uniref:hypothetical protein n=1 Tax=Aestuariivirga sp. TaxID=2650926 RepID=UPI00301627CC
MVSMVGISPRLSGSLSGESLPSSWPAAVPSSGAAFWSVSGDGRAHVQTARGGQRDGPHEDVHTLLVRQARKADQAQRAAGQQVIVPRTGERLDV